MMLRGWIGRLAIILFFALVVGYGYFEGSGIFFGPTISVPESVMQTSKHLVTIKGRVQHVSSLTINGSPISITESGDFSEPYVLAPGYNRVTLDARDKYSKTASRVIEIIYTPTATSTPTAATSTLPNATTTPEVAPNRQ